MIISPPFPTNKSQCFGQQAISYSDISEVNEYIKYKNLAPMSFMGYHSTDATGNC